MVSWELEKAARLLRDPPIQDGSTGVQSNAFWVLITQLPTNLQDEAAIRTCYREWGAHITFIGFVPDCASAEKLSIKRQTLLRTIERRETNFMSEMVRLHRSETEEAFALQLAAALSQSHNKLTLCKGKVGKYVRWNLPSWLPYDLQPVSSLYLSLIWLNARFRQKLARIKNEQSTAALVALDQDHFARALAYHHPSTTISALRMRYLGVTTAHVIPSNLRGASLTDQTRRETINILATILVVLWTIPVGASGVLS
ncbi:phosphatidylinositol glycan, class S [Fonsecaea nubica]|uniref:Phosphatidylinositol glycan, class S n=1 Tax=Fonsecaea nubica TaxID=856822 RepID=A0A178BS10_9EURO|nr:phosphatidylinositol glycan, class S [Fonsecaea nubica]OAL19722.1 phosphatidylinositol glycan, class S [Fonsecaea nubica]